LDYYVSHKINTEGKDTMTFSGNNRDVKPAPKATSDSLAFDEKNVMAVQFATQDDPEALSSAAIFAIAVFIIVFGGIIWYAIWAFTNDKFEAWVMALVITGGFVAALIAAVLVFFLAYVEATPGENMEKVEEPGKAIQKVNATNMTVFGFVSYVLYKFFNTKKTAQQETPAAVEETEIESANVLM
jgi:hypothetical protein